MNYLAYNKLSLLQRKAFIAFLTLFLLCLSYGQLYYAAVLSLGRSREVFQHQENIFAAQRKLISQYHETQLKIKQLQLHLNNESSEAYTLKIAHQLFLVNFQFTPIDQQHLMMSFTSTWETLLNFLNLLSETTLSWNLIQLETQRDYKDQMLSTSLQFEEIPNNIKIPSLSIPKTNNENNLNVDPFSNSSQANEPRLLGILQQNETLIAIFILPDQKIIGLKTADHFENSPWIIHSITKDQVIMENTQNGHKITQSLHHTGESL